MLHVLVGMIFGILFLALTVYYVITISKLTFLVAEIAYTGIKQSIERRSVQLKLKESTLNTYEV